MIQVSESFNKSAALFQVGRRKSGEGERRDPSGSIPSGDDRARPALVQDQDEQAFQGESSTRAVDRQVGSTPVPLGDFEFLLCQADEPRDQLDTNEAPAEFEGSDAGRG